MIYHRRLFATINAHAAIPGNDSGGAKSTFKCRLPGKIVTAKVTVDIGHTAIGDLRVSLISPAGTVVVLHNRAAGKDHHLKHTFEGEVLNSIKGQEAEGQWTLHVVDFAAHEHGAAHRLHQWKLELELRRRVAAVAHYHKDVNQNITGGDGISSLISVPKQAKGVKLKTANLKLHLHFEHPHIEGLSIHLRAPSGKRVHLHNRSGWSSYQTRRTFSGAGLGELANENLIGDWTLQIAAPSGKEVGKLIGWDIEFTHDPDLHDVANLDKEGAAHLASSGIHTRAQLEAAVPLEVSSILALHRHADPVGVASHLVASH